MDARWLVAGTFFVAFLVTGLVLAGWDAGRRGMEARLQEVREAAGLSAEEAAAARGDGEGRGLAVGPEPGPGTAAGRRRLSIGSLGRRVLEAVRQRGAARAAARAGAAASRAGAAAPREPEVPASIRNLARRLRRAGLPWRVEEFLTLQAVSAAAGGGLLVLVGHKWAWGIAGALAGWFAPQLYVQARQARRLARCAADLPAALSMMSNALKAGHSFLQAAETVATELDSPLAEEFGQMVHEIRLNVSTEDALANLVDRVRSDDLDLVVTAVLIQRQVGGNLAQLLDQIAHTIRERVRIQGEVRVLTSQGRLSGWIVGALPVALLVLVSMMNPDYLTPLFHTGLGRAMLAGAATMEAIGALLIYRIVRIEV